MKHTKEPWRVEYHTGIDKSFLIQGPGFTVDYDDVDHEQADADADRAVACVNALAGIEDPAAFMADAAKLCEALEYNQWGMYGERTDAWECPECEFLKEEGHETTCRIGIALRTPLALAVKAGREKGRE